MGAIISFCKQAKRLVSKGILTVKMVFLDFNHVYEITLFIF